MHVPSHGVSLEYVPLFQYVGSAAWEPGLSVWGALHLQKSEVLFSHRKFLILVNVPCSTAITLVCLSPYSLPIL